MDFCNFSKWVEEKLQPNIPSNTVVIFDNGNKENEKRPTSLMLEKIFSPDMTKPEFHMLVRPVPVNKKYTVCLLYTSRCV